MFLYRQFDLDSRVEREARSLVAAGYEVEVIGVTGEGLPARDSRDGYTITRVAPESFLTRLPLRLSRLPLLGALARRAYFLLRMPIWSRRAARAAEERPAALLVGHDVDGLGAAVRAKRALGAPLIYDAHELFPDMAAAGRPDYERRGWIRYERRLIRHADAVFAVTASRAEVMARRFAISPRVIRNVPETSHEPAEPAADLRESLAAGARAGVVLLYLGGMQASRGLEEAIRALERLPDCRLVLMGSGEERYVERLRTIAHEAGVAERLEIRPPVRPHEVVAVTAAADVGVVLNHRTNLNNYLSLPNKIFEYVVAGLPVVASDFPDMAELVNGYGVGVTCDPEDPAGIARAVEAVLRERERYREGARRAAPELTWERESEAFLSSVAELVAS
jgi:glycosyltransferase involved in cell wall biosynthesis